MPVHREQESVSQRWWWKVEIRKGDKPGDRARLAVQRRDHQALVLGRTGRLEEQVDDELVRQDNTRRLVGIEERGGFEDVVLRLRRRGDREDVRRPFKRQQGRKRALTMVPQAVKLQPSSSR